MARTVTVSGEETKFPNGVSDAGQADYMGRTEVTGKATIPTGLAAVEGCVASLEEVSATAKHGALIEAKKSATVGAIDVVVKDTVGAEATTAVFVNWAAYGPA